MELEFIRELIKPARSKIILLVMDGLGGLPMEAGGETALEAAATPNLDRLAAEGICGLQTPVASGITPGSGPGHLGLFGYDPLRYVVGRGVLSSLGIGFKLQKGDVAARGNFCTINEHGEVIDRRAGRISSEKGEALVERLQQISLPDVACFVEHVKEYRFTVVLRGKNLSATIADTDPQETGVEPLPPKPLKDEAQATAELVEQFLDQAREILAEEEKANFVLLRGFSSRPEWPSFGEVFGLRAAAVALYPMYRGVARLVGMDTLETGNSLEEQIDTIAGAWDDYDFFFLHVKPIDSAGEDGDFERKASLIEDVDALVPRIRELGADVLIVTGDHSTPALLKYHSWHPVPVIIWSAQCRPDEVERFGERACMRGGLGPRFPAAELMPLALANALRLEKFGA